jgi:hypothetical protein
VKTVALALVTAWLAVFVFGLFAFGLGIRNERRNNAEMRKHLNGGGK